ncbi:hypothetical protein PVMG_04601 [Plasmodium vivax Mauritania I]|uniref:Variable surface protein n=1 Tax=Plasmodium vivax Mauritania I TaxID=1035515 RepID=A0A0J9T432_PLAVI|nr:hypothetical protein PVMG_04601 [Plasmodium vivax Mauritania I]
MVNAYKAFNNTLDADEKTAISILANNLTNIGGFFEKHRDVYEKLIRNLLYLFNNIYERKSAEYCRFLYQWLYISRYKNNISNFPINIAYNASEKRFVVYGEASICPYYSYDTNYIEPINIIKLKNFLDYINIIVSTMKNKKEPNYSLCQKYICECVNIYKSMFKAHCSHEDTTGIKLKNTCDILKDFDTSYTAFLYNNDDLRDKIPSLYVTESVPFQICTVEEEKPRQVHASRSELSQEPGTRPSVETEPSSAPVVDEQSDNPIRFNTTSVVSAMAGIPPFLALIYKVIIICT